MKIYAIIVLMLSLIMILLPLLFINKDNSSIDNTNQTQYQVLTSQEDKTTTVAILRVNSSNIENVSIFDYVKGCVANEMPMSYEDEALKAQAVLCYTYLKWIEENADKSDFDGADITDSSDTHQGYLDQEQQKQLWADNYDKYSDKLDKIIESVFTQYLQYDNEVILACYHGISSGNTNSAKTVWGKDIPYLKSCVAIGDKLSPDYEKQVSFSIEEMEKLILKFDGVSTDKIEEKNWFSNAVKTPSGFVEKIDVCGMNFDGTQIRSALKLRSTNFDIKFDDDTFSITTYGYGHGIGMSQYSANYMARQGSNYEQILLHFFDDCTLIKN